MEYLAHYGIVGMRWGRRRANKLEGKIKQNNKDRAESNQEWREIGKYHNKSDAWVKDKISGYNAIIDHQNYKNQEKINKIKAKEKNFGKAADRVEKLSTGKTIAQSLVFGTYGAVKYNQNKAEGKSTLDSVLNTLGPTSFNNLTLGVHSTKESRRQ